MKHVVRIASKQVDVVTFTLLPYVKSQANRRVTLVFSGAYLCIVAEMDRVSLICCQ